MKRWLTVIVCMLAAACASERPAGTVFDSSAGHVVVEVLGDGFVRTGDRRIPLEALVLELRQATRLMSPDELSRYVVHLRLSPTIGDGAAAKIAEDGCNRLINELDIMEVPQVKYL